MAFSRRVYFPFKLVKKRLPYTPMELPKEAKTVA
jgi:hypothetical protein